jgi:two-component system OmpR family sensor kinase
MHTLVRALLWAHRNERRRVLTALSHAEVLRANQHESNMWRAQIHEIGSGLLVLEGAMQRLVLQPGTDTELAGAVGAEIARLRVLLDPSAKPALDEHYMLADALSPVLTCARASGMTLRGRIDADLAACGDPLVTAQVVHGLLANANRHARGSPVDVSCERNGTDVIVRVADHGPGLLGAVRGRVFEPGVRDVAGGGHGLGLWITGQLVESQRGRIGVLERSDGLTFEVRLPTAAGA